MKNIKSLSIFKSVIGTTFAVAFIVLSSASFANADMLYRQLEVGATGADVSTLQSFLAKDTTIYPQGLITGYFGTLTKTAVSTFQTRNNIASVGRVGPITLSVINAQMGSNVSSDVYSPQIYNVNVSTNTNTANVRWNTNESAFGLVYYSTSPLIITEHLNSLDVSGMTAITQIAPYMSQNIAISGLQSNTTYYYLVYSTDQAGNVSATFPSTFRTN